MAPNTLLTRNHGVASWAALQKAGVSRADLRQALHTGALTKLRRGWYGSARAHPAVVASVRAGGVCSCVSALRLHGVWIPEGYGMTHMRARSAAHNQRLPGLCHRHGRPLREDGAVDDVPTAFAHAVRCLDAEGIVVVCDSLMNLGLMSRDEIEVALRSSPRKTQALLDKCARAEAGTETMARLRLRRHHLSIQTQVQIPDVGRVDLLVGRRLIIEIDGQEYHHTPEQFYTDRARDLAAFRLGYLPVRLGYRQVAVPEEWTISEEAILAIVRRGEHLAALPNADLRSDPALSLP